MKVNEEEAKVVRKIFDWLVYDGLTIYQIQKRLNGMKAPTKFDRIGREKRSKVKCWWHQTTIYRILTREMYTGVYWWRKYKKNPHNFRKKPENLRPRKDWILVKVPAIITGELFEKAQERLRENKAFSKSPKILCLFRRKIVCGFDGRKYTVAYRKPKTPKDSGTIYYTCPNRFSNQSPIKCKAPSIAESRLEVAGLKRFLEELGKGLFKVEVHEGRLEEGASPFAAPILDVSAFHEVGPIGKPVAVLIDVLKERLLSREVKLICMFCGEWESIVKVGSLPDDVKCPRCGARFVAVTWKGDRSIKRVLSLRRSGKQPLKQDRKVLETAQRSGSLVLSYGKKAVVAMAARGVGPQTATRILAKHRSSEEEFYLDILEAERQYARTRAFWDEGA